MYAELQKRLEEIVRELNGLEDELSEAAEGFEPPRSLMGEDEAEEVREAWDEACDCLTDASGCLGEVLKKLAKLSR